jgi:prepilin-type N-terminal cleavage/methylation domain-containing protein/prepilin-type processing-associated H-X9-DG protein
MYVRPITQRKGFTLIELLVVIAIIAVLVGLLLPAVSKVREAASRAQCQNNLKQLGLALINYHGSNGGFPPANSGPPHPHSWTVFILPFMEQGNLQQQYNFSVNWNATVNNPVISQNVKLFICPSAPSDRKAVSIEGIIDYPATCRVHAAILKSMNVPVDGKYEGVLGYIVSRKVSDINDGASNTLLLAEDAGRPEDWVNGTLVKTSGLGGGWANPGEFLFMHNAPCAAAVNCNNNRNVYAFHIGTANAVFGDGSVRPLKSTTPINVLAALITRRGGEVIPDDSY